LSPSGTVRILQSIAQQRVVAAPEVAVEVSARRVGDVAVLEVSGKVLGGPESDVLRTELERVLAGGDRYLLVDLAGVPWMNSAGLGILLAAYARLRERGGILRFSGVGERVRGILRTTKLLTVLDVVDDESTGIRSFAERPGGGG
jgi:anti-sigma B factor antagonist